MQQMCSSDYTMSPESNKNENQKSNKNTYFSSRWANQPEGVSSSTAAEAADAV